jgi:hypothetical protein
VKKAFILLGICFLFCFNSFSQQNTDSTLKATISGISGGKISISTFFISDIICTDTNYVICSYTISMTIKGDLIEKNINGNRLTAELVNYLNDLRIGDKIYFTKIKAKSTDNKTINLPSVKITLIE